MPLSASSPSSLYCTESPTDVASWDPDSPSAEWAPLLPRRPISHLLSSESDGVYSYTDSADRHAAVNDFYRFRPVTAYLSVDYLDRFLSSHSLPVGSGWPVQLLSVACVSVAAKMEETQVPLLPDLQVLAPRFVFEPRTVRRMELLLMSSLRWRMRPVTPFDFLEHLADALPPENVGSLLSSAADIFVRSRRIVDFLGYRPSVTAAAAVIHSAREIADFSASGGELFRRSRDWVSEEILKGCLQLLEEHMTDTCKSTWRDKPLSPIGVLDAAACTSCDRPPEPSPSEPPIKRRRLGGD
ncbi:cyclin-D1-1-like [Iris pallida]|uniref:Cyclin-D1-1-like n=1 Tax=Iris pallida TaxID=29817 RepID=A0AAX6EW57_IRIPA|nr:cyclin-D1-1-like [Iris pallida]KAJ6812806.1 cyclin-D1-1-like [Iris pallida]